MTRQRLGNWLAVLFFLLPIIEVVGLIGLGAATNLWVVFAVIVGTALVGIGLASLEGRRTWRELRAAVHEARSPQAELADASLIFVGAILLMLPGLLTDVVGLALVVPWTRSTIRRKLGWQTSPLPRSAFDSGTVIEGQVVPDADPGDDPPRQDEILK